MSRENCSPASRVYVLTSHDTFSGGEEFCYNLKI